MLPLLQLQLSRSGSSSSGGNGGGGGGSSSSSSSSDSFRNVDLFQLHQYASKTGLFIALTKLRKATISFVMSVYPSLSPSARNNSAPTEGFSLQSDKKNGYFT